MPFDRDYFEDLYEAGDGDPWGYWESEYERTKARRTVATLDGRRSPGEVDQILDLGCGNGAKTRLLTEHYPDADVVGVDVSAAALDIARERVESARFVRGDLLEFVAETERSFDVVVAIESLFYPATEHAVTGMLSFADDLRNVLSAEGVLVATHLLMPRGVGPIHAQARTTAVLVEILESAFETVGRAHYDARKRTALDTDEPQAQPYEVRTMRPLTASDG